MIERGLTIIIEIDKRFTMGIEWLPPYIFGVRFGFIAIHLVTITLDSMLYVEEMKSERGE